MIAIMDVHYRESKAVAACVVARDWSDESPAFEFVETLPPAAEYVSGEFYKRELPCLLAVLAKVPDAVEIVVIDGYVWLGPDRKGLGAHLHEALGNQTPVVGVAKTRFVSAAGLAIALERGTSENPLWITSIGIEPEAAARAVRSMHGEFRIPTLIKRVDRLCRDA
jgi:deoxyribonuclease V